MFANVYHAEGDCRRHHEASLEMLLAVYRLPRAALKMAASSARRHRSVARAASPTSLSLVCRAEGDPRDARRRYEACTQTLQGC
jgi:hypothetical protein